MEFKLDLVSEDIVRCTISGRLLIDDEVKQILEQLDTFTSHHYLIDLSNLEHTSSSGLSLFIRLLTRSKINDKKIALFNLQENITKLFNITKLNDIFAIFNLEEEAINYLKK